MACGAGRRCQSWRLLLVSAACFSAAAVSASLEPVAAIAATGSFELERAKEPAVPPGPAEARFTALGEALLQRWAPSFVQVTSLEHPERDRPLPIDFDGDWIATNNWSHLGPQHRDATPTVYGSAVLTRTHAFLTFTLFYPRDWASPVCVPYVCHDNDLEVVGLVARLGAGASASELVFVETKAHTEYVARDADEIELDPEGRPYLHVESQGHGIYPMRRGELAAFAGQPRFVYEPRGPRLVAWRDESDGRRGAARARGRAEGVSPAEPYALVSLRDTLWARRSAEAHSGLWASAEAGSHEYSGARFGRHGRSIGVLMANVHYPGGVRPPWSLHASAGARGDWFLDPAYVAAARHPQWLSPASTSLEYVDNPFLADLAAECSGDACPPALARAAPPTHTASLAGGTLALLAWLVLRVLRRAS